MTISNHLGRPLGGRRRDEQTDYEFFAGLAALLIEVAIERADSSYRVTTRRRARRLSC